MSEKKNENKYAERKQPHAPFTCSDFSVKTLKVDDEGRDKQGDAANSSNEEPQRVT